MPRLSCVLRVSRDELFSFQARLRPLNGNETASFSSVIARTLLFLLQ
ncbi:hypothetical protein [Desulfolithobacter sp.]